MTAATSTPPDTAQSRTQALHRPWMVGPDDLDRAEVRSLLLLDGARRFADEPHRPNRWAGCQYWLCRDGLAGTGIDYSSLPPLPARIRSLIARAADNAASGVSVRFGEPHLDDGRPLVDVVEVARASLQLRANPNLVTHVERCAGPDGAWRLVPTGADLAPGPYARVLAYVAQDGTVLGVIAPHRPRERG